MLRCGFVHIVFLYLASGVVVDALERHCQCQWWKHHSGAEGETGPGNGSCEQDRIAFVL